MGADVSAPVGCTILRPSRALVSSRQLLLKEDFAAGTIQDRWRWRFLLAQRAEAVRQDRCLELFVPDVRHFTAQISPSSIAATDPRLVHS
jgi:hypothetical protein